MDAEKFGEYTEKPDSAWNLVEEGVFEYLLKRYYKDKFSWLNHEENRLIPAITTRFDSLIPEDFRVLDLGTGTGRIPRSLIKFGVLPENIVGVDNNQGMFSGTKYPFGVNKLCTDVTKLLPALKTELSEFGNFDLVTANMLFHLLSYRDYLNTLKQVRKIVTDHARLYIMVPHPYRRDQMDSIPAYHKRGSLAEKAPWGEVIPYKAKTISDYCRGLKQSGFHCWLLRTTGVGLELEDNLLDSDMKIWSTIQVKRKGVITKNPPRYFRIWLVAFPE